MPPLPTRTGRLRLPVLCFVASQETARDGDVEKVVTEAVAGGATMIQLREKSMPAGELLNLARRLKAITRGKALLIINDRIDVAIAVEADGVQVPDDGLPTLTTRGLIGRYAVLGRSVHDVDAALRAGREGAEFILAGTVYKSATHPELAAQGPTLIRQIADDNNLHVVAIGGITAANVAEVVAAGADGVAVVSAIAGAEDPKAATEELAAALKAAWSARGETVGATA